MIQTVASCKICKNDFNSSWKKKSQSAPAGSVPLFVSCLDQSKDKFKWQCQVFEKQFTNLFKKHWTANCISSSSLCLWTWQFFQNDRFQMAESLGVKLLFFSRGEKEIRILWQKQILGRSGCGSNCTKLAQPEQSWRLDEDGSGSARRSCFKSVGCNPFSILFDSVRRTKLSQCTRESSLNVMFFCRCNRTSYYRTESPLSSLFLLDFLAVV